MNVIGFKEARCKNCFKCVRVCEVKAITFKKDQAQILNDKCILCGECLEACPQNAKTFISDIELVKKFLKEKTPVVVSIAPSYLAAF
ncbi:MAG: 4Fe-4S dicluster domain-containing protein, partial [Fusobacteriaceae bacterium]